MLEEEVGALRGLEHRSARVPAQIDHEAGRTLRHECLDRLPHECLGLLAEVIDPQQARAARELPPRDVGHDDLGAHERDVLEPVGERIAHGQDDGAVDRSTDPLRRLRDRHAGRRRSVDPQDAIAGLQPRLRGGPSRVHVADHQLAAGVLADRAADSRELPRDALVESREPFVGEDRRVRVERGRDALEHLDLEIQSGRQLAPALDDRLELRERGYEIEHVRPVDAQRREHAARTVGNHHVAAVLLDDQPRNDPFERLGGAGQGVGGRDRVRTEIVVVHQLERALRERGTHRRFRRERRADEVETEHAVREDAMRDSAAPRAGDA